MKESALIKKHEKDIRNIQRKINELQNSLKDKKNQSILVDQNPAKLKAIHFKLTVSKMLLDDAVDLLHNRKTKADSLIKDVSVKPSSKQSMLPI